MLPGVPDDDRPPIDGNALSRQIRADVAQRAAALTARGHRPGLAVILVGEDPASQVYVRNKVKACDEAGLHSVLETYDATLPEAELLARIAALNADPAIHGILVQMPLPTHIDAAQGDRGDRRRQGRRRLLGRQRRRRFGRPPGFRPCTPYGCMKLIESTGSIRAASTRW